MNLMYWFFSLLLFVNCILVLLILIPFDFATGATHAIFSTIMKSGNEIY